MKVAFLFNGYITNYMIYNLLQFPHPPKKTNKTHHYLIHE